MTDPIYLDNAASTKVDEKVLAQMLPYFTEIYGNANSVQHAAGRKADFAIEIAREQVAKTIGAENPEIIFTSGATESLNTSIKGIFETFHQKGKHIITSMVEHKAVLETCRHLAKLGAEITFLPVDENGIIKLEDLKKSIREDTVLIAIMFANNETGVCQPISEIGKIAKETNTIFLCDTTQAIGKIPIDVNAYNIDLMTISAHKIYGPKGIGALYARRKSPRVSFAPLLDGGGQERKRRSGTLNVPGIVGLGKACEMIADYQKDWKRIKEFRDHLENEICRIFPQSQINGKDAKRLPNISNISFNTINSNQILAASYSELAISAGSACVAGSNDPSYVLQAMGLSFERSTSSIRFSLSKYTTEEEIKATIEFFKEKILPLVQL